MKVREIRTQRGLTQHEFAQAIGVNHITVCRWECGHSIPHPKNREKIKTFSNQDPTKKNTLIKTTPEEIKLLRNKMGLTQKELARKLNVYAVTICRWERGHSKPDIENRKKITEIYNLFIETQDI